MQPTPPTVSPSLHNRAASSGASAARFVGVDIARFLAIIGMMATHLLAVNAMNPGASDLDQTVGKFAETFTSGIAAPLFAVLGGLSMVFATRRLLRDGMIGAAISAVALRGAILVVIGMLLGLIESPIIVVLAYYGVAMLIVAPLIAARSWILATLATVLAVAGGALNAVVRTGLGVVGEGGSVTFEAFFNDPLENLRALLLTGQYPAITWVAYMLVGVLIGRAFVEASARGTLARTAIAVGSIGAAIAAAAQLISAFVIANLGSFGFEAVPGVEPELFTTLLAAPSFGAPMSPLPWAQLAATPHSGSPLDLLRTIGIALAVISVLVLIFDVALGNRKPSRLTNIVRSAGAAPLTIYTLHIAASGMLFSTALADAEAIADANGMMPWWAAGIWAFFIQLAGVLAIGTVLSFTGRRGPLEALVSGVVKTTVRS